MADLKAMEYLRGLEEAELLARMLKGEAGNQDQTGRLGVGSVVMNRVGNSRYGDSVRDVLLKDGQFSMFNNATGYAGGEQGSDVWKSPAGEEYLTMANQLLSKAYEDPTGGATEYYNPSISDPVWGRNKPGKMIGDHKFLNANNTSPASSARPVNHEQVQARMADFIQPNIPGNSSDQLRAFADQREVNASKLQKANIALADGMKDDSEAMFRAVVPDMMPPAPEASTQPAWTNGFMQGGGGVDRVQGGTGGDAGVTDPTVARATPVVSDNHPAIMANALPLSTVVGANGGVAPGEVPPAPKAPPQQQQGRQLPPERQNWFNRNRGGMYTLGTALSNIGRQNQTSMADAYQDFYNMEERKRMTNLGIPQELHTEVERYAAELVRKNPDVDYNDAVQYANKVLNPTSTSGPGARTVKFNQYKAAFPDATDAEILTKMDATSGGNSDDGIKIMADAGVNLAQLQSKRIQMEEAGAPPEELEVMDKRIDVWKAAHGTQRTDGMSDKDRLVDDAKKALRQSGVEPSLMDAYSLAAIMEDPQGSLNAAQLDQAKANLVKYGNIPPEVASTMTEDAVKEATLKMAGGSLDLNTADQADLKAGQDIAESRPPGPVTDAYKLGKITGDEALRVENETAKSDQAGVMDAHITSVGGEGFAGLITKDNMEEYPSLYAAALAQKAEAELADQRASLQTAIQAETDPRFEPLKASLAAGAITPSAASDQYATVASEVYSTGNPPPTDKQRFLQWLTNDATQAERDTFYKKAKAENKLYQGDMTKGQRRLFDSLDEHVQASIERAATLASASPEREAVYSLLQGEIPTGRWEKAMLPAKQFVYGLLGEDEKNITSQQTLFNALAQSQFPAKATGLPGALSNLEGTKVSDSYAGLDKDPLANMLLNSVDTKRATYMQQYADFASEYQTNAILEDNQDGIKKLSKGALSAAWDKYAKDPTNNILQKEDFIVTGQDEVEDMITRGVWVDGDVAIIDGKLQQFWLRDF